MCGDDRLRRAGNGSLEAVSALGDPRQRRILSVLQDRASPMTVRDLAVRLAAEEAGTAVTDVTEEDHRPIRVDLHHRCLPKLEALGWIDRRPEGVVAVGGPSLAVERGSLLEGRDADKPDGRPDDARPAPEAIDALLARPRRRELVSILAEYDRRLSLAELATELAEHRRDSRTRERDEDETSVRCTLHHVDLPRLAEAGLIEYDHDERTITPTRRLRTLADRTDRGEYSSR